MPLPVLRLRPIPGTDTTDTGHTAMDTMATDLMDMDTTMERGLLMLSPLLMLLPVLRLRPIPGTDTMDTLQALRLWILWLQTLRLCLLGLSLGQQQLPVSPCRLCCKTPVFAKQFSFCSEK